MLYNCLKILHIFSAALLLTSISYCYYLWKQMQDVNTLVNKAKRIQKQTGFIIAPSAFVQLSTGFTMISLERYDLSQLWITGSVFGFLIVVSSWLAFMYFLILSAQISPHLQRHPKLLAVKYRAFRRTQFLMLAICASALLGMIFLMANRIA